MELFILEHKKLWRRKSTIICVLLSFIYIVIFGGVLSYQWFSFGSLTDDTTAFGNHFDGYSNIRNKQEYASSWGGELTDEILQQMVADYQQMHAAERYDELEKTEWKTINNWLEILYPELKDSNTYDLMISYVEPEMLTGFYDRRQQAIEDFLEISGQIGDERDYLLQMNDEVKEPFYYEWVEGWSLILGSILPDLGKVMAIFLAIVLATIFAGEWHNNTGSLILTTKNGWKKLGYAKIGTGLMFVLELFAMLTIGGLVTQVFFLGTNGWDMPIQCVKLIAVANMNMLQAEIYQYAFVFLGAIGFAGVVMLLSAFVKNNFFAVLFSIAFVCIPGMIAQYLPYWAQKALDLLPLVGSSADIFRTNTFCIFGMIIWSPYLLITVPVLLGGLCIPIAVKCWTRRGKV